MILWPYQGNLHKIKNGTSNTSMLNVVKSGDPPKSLDELGGFFYIKAINNNNNKRKIVTTRTKMKESFLFIVSLPSFMKFGIIDMLEKKLRKKFMKKITLEEYLN